MCSISTYVEKNELIPTILENRARTNPNGIWAKFPNSPTTYTEGFKSATYRELSNAVNRVAWLLEDNFGKSTTFETIAYLGPNDLRCTIVVLAGIKAGYKTFLPSPRNSKIAQITLFTKLDCKVLITTDPELPCVPMIVEELPLKRLVIPSVLELLASEGPDYPYNATYEDAKDDPIFVLHSSGSTGIPKPLTYTHMFTLCVSNITSLPMKDGFVNLNTNFQTGAFYSVFPSFHIVGIGFSLIIPSFYSCIPIYPLPSAPPSTASFLSALNHTPMDWAFLPPVLIDELGQDATSLDLVASKLKYLYFSGGAVPTNTGDIVSAKLPLHQVMGSSECAMFPLIREEDTLSSVSWSYIQVHPASNVEFRHRFGDLHELVVVRKPEHEKYQAIFTHFPDLQEYETRDLFSAHPTKPGFWKHRSRIDDVIVFLNGEKTNPVTFEQQVGEHPEVKAALVVGAQRFEAALLVELVKEVELSPEEKEEMIESIWPVVQHANTQCPSHARVSKSMIVLADPAMPFLRAPKGTIQRQATLNQYEKILDDLYLANSSDKLETEVGDLKISDTTSIVDVVRELVKRVTDWKEFKDTDDFFALGMDSLQILHLRRNLLAVLDNDSPFLTPAFLYANPSVELLAQALAQGLFSDQAPDFGESRAKSIASTLQKYEDKIDELALAQAKKALTPPASPRQSHGEVILLTGSTGALGSFILDTLLQNDCVSRVYCLNRSTDSESIQRARNLERGLPTSFPSNRVKFLATDLTLPNFGIDLKIFEEMLSTTTKIIHNAWPVDFNKTLQSFQPSLDGVLGLIAFATSATRDPSIFFISSISSVGNYQNSTSPAPLPLIPEMALTDLATPAPMGYGESKYIAERILDYASKKLQLSTAAARVGQVAGTASNPRGWNRREWFPSLIVSSKFMGVVPETLGLGGDSEEGIDWVCIDQLVGVLAGFVLNAQKGREERERGVRIYHPVHPKPRSWDSLLPTVMASLASGGEEVKAVQFREWVRMLRATSEVEVASEDAAEMLHRNPGVKLLDFYESLLAADGLGETMRMKTTETLKASEALRDLEPLRNEWLQGWIEGWVKS